MYSLQINNGEKNKIWTSWFLAVSVNNDMYLLIHSIALW